MTPDEILDYNKRCAEFLGVDVNYSTEVYKDSKSTLRQYIHNMPKSESLKFHSDWNWIMEVVKAIEKLNFAVEINSDTCVIQSNDGEYSESSNCMVNCSYEEYSTHSSKKEAVVQAINQLLIWYNENNRRV